MTTLKELADRLEDLLPQTQCTKCAYPACRPYAEAIADGSANYNQCPPGGHEGIVRLARLLGRPVVSLNPEHGQERPRPVAVIDEALCIGCTLCIQACPVDAIVGAPKQMHTVVESLCTGCDLCVAPCPVDCIAMQPVTGAATGWEAWSQKQADDARLRHDRHLARLARLEEQRAARAAGLGPARLNSAAAASGSGDRNPTVGDLGSGAPPAPLASPAAPTATTADQANRTLAAASAQTDPTADTAQAKQAIIEAALQRARAKQAAAAAAGQQPRNVGSVSPATQAQIDAADARRRRLGLQDNDAADSTAGPAGEDA